ncbi:MAG: AAA family ATPase [Eubacteriales bacterium]|nr:AAA family ATPase [Eubacteriales bacterium]
MKMLMQNFERFFQIYFYLLNSDKLNPYQKSEFDRIAGKTASKEEFENSLLRQTSMLAAHYGKPVILLIDEYDVPLAKANVNGYYKEMLSTVRGIMSVLKDNPDLKFAVVTGCLQIAKESIFTGTNNLICYWLFSWGRIQG